MTGVQTCALPICVEQAAVAGLFDALPAGLTFDAISFARKSRPLLPEAAPGAAPQWPDIHDKPARERVAAILDAGSREQGTDLAAALALVGQRINLRNARRPLVLVITDGMLPLGAGAGPLGQVFSDSLGKRKGDRPELIFLVDEPMLVRTGIAADHPIAQLAAGLGARISLANLAQYGRDGGEAFARNLLRAPGVLRELSVGLPPHAVLDDPPPAGLVAPGSGPRHFAFCPDGKFAYVINELSSTITAFSYDASAGRLDEVQTITTLPAGFSGNNSTAEVQVHPSGRFVYGSNRGHDSIAIFAVDRGSGKLTAIGHEPTQGKTPRNFGIDPTGRYLLAANQGTNNLVLFRIDAATGKLTATGATATVGAPVCVKFAEDR